MKKENRGRKAKRVIVTAAAVFLALLLTGVLIFRKEIGTVMSMQRIDGTNLYCMEYQPEYDLDELLQMGTEDVDDMIGYIVYRLSHKLLPPSFFRNVGLSYSNFACTCFSAEAESGNKLFCRNFDYGEEGAILLSSHPKKGYASMSFCTPVYAGVDARQLASHSPARLLTLALLYFPMDGMNEKGLAITVNEMTHHPTWQDTEKPDILTPVVLRLVLDRCATVDEAVELIRQIDVHDPRYDLGAPDVVGSSYHYLIADAEGSSAVVEFDYEDGFRVMCVPKEADKSYQICTNHYLSEKFAGEGDEVGDTYGRYEYADSVLREKKPALEDCFSVLSATRMDRVLYAEYGDYYCSTQWSAVYDLTDRCVSVCVGQDYDRVYTFALEQSNP